MGCKPSKYSNKYVIINSNKWDYLEELGKGTFGVVVKAKCDNYSYKSNSIFGAVKIFIKKTNNYVYEQNLKSSYHKDIVYREIESLYKFSHPNIIRVYGMSETSNNIFLLMEFIHGVTLYKWIRDHNTSEIQNIKFTKNLTNAINHIHIKGYLFIDLKCENIIVKNGILDDGFKIIDFGSVEKQDSPVSNYRIITKGYCSPELFYKNKASKSNDIWSIGVISFILHHKYMPYSSRLYKKDLTYRSWPGIRYKNASENAIDFWNNVLKLKQIERYKANDILSHPWLNDGKIIIL